MKTPRTPKHLYHFSCSHGADGIDTMGFVLPVSMVPGANLSTLAEGNRWLADLCWFTDDPAPERLALGLTSFTIDCDRMERRYEVDPPESLRWWPAKILELDPVVRRQARALSNNPGAQPGRWWVANRPVRVLSFA